METNKNIIKSLSSSRKMILGFIFATLIGSLILVLPFCLEKGQSLTLLQSLFTITSAICVTGLSVVDVSKVFSPVGQTVILIFIQLGGLGVMTFSSLIYVVAGKKMTYHERMILKDERNADESEEITKFLKKIILTILLIESIGAVILTLVFMRELQFSLGKAIFYGIFHSISAFCNAGFSLFSNGLEGFAKNVTVNLSIAYLIILGGIGFSVINSFVTAVRKDITRFNLTSKLSIFISIILTFGGTILFLFLEYKNVLTIGNMGIIDKIIASFFQSVTTRTAGFNTVPLAGMKEGTIFMFCILMFIGASPGSTGGGIKTTTLGVIAFYVLGIVKGKEHIDMFNRRIDWEILNRALAILVIAILYVSVVIMMILTVENFRFEQIVFEVISAFATVGLTLGITPELSWFSQLLIIITMFVGRLGPLTFALAIGETKKKEQFKYPKENILVG
ncbi:MAG: TrkH family potassium uptake protein [Fusobacteriaceae bacterium]